MTRRIDPLAEFPARREMPKSKVGDLTEYGAVMWLVNQGYEVFRNVICVGPVDLVAMRPNGGIVLVDVKTPVICRRDDGSFSVYKVTLSEHQQRLNVRVLYAHFETSTFSFSLDAFSEQVAERLNRLLEVPA